MKSLNTYNDREQECVDKMIQAGQSDFSIRAFLRLYREAIGKGEGGIWMNEKDLDPVMHVPIIEAPPSTQRKSAEHFFSQCVVLKLNGGLGSSMGLTCAKALLDIKKNLNVLDVLFLQLEKHPIVSPLILFNSHHTSAATMRYIHTRKNEHFSKTIPAVTELIQHNIPRLCPQTHVPVQSPGKEGISWCPPGHGNVYNILYESGTIDTLLECGYKYLFISNSDNLGATLDADLATYFASSSLSFMMEVCRRRNEDQKGGHLAYRKRDGLWIVREAAQCSEQDRAFFADVHKYRYFNTNNLWMKLRDLKKKLVEWKGLLPLPVLRSTKPIDIQVSSSPKCWQLETAAGAAITLFGSKAKPIVVSRDRFRPIKFLHDLMFFRSDATKITRKGELRDICSEPPRILLDELSYQRMGDLEALLKDNIPSLRFCTSLELVGQFQFSANVVLIGAVRFVNKSRTTVIIIPTKYYVNEEVIF